MAVVDMFSQSAPTGAPIPPPPGGSMPPPITPSPAPGASFFGAPPPPPAVAPANSAPPPTMAPAPPASLPESDSIMVDDNNPSPNEPLTDSFGEPIKPEDIKLENVSPKPPAFVEGAFAGIPNMPAPAEVADAGAIQPTPAVPTIPTPHLITAKEKTISGLPVIVIVILHIAILGLIGLAVFALWYSQFQTINELNGKVSTLTDTSNSRLLELQNTQTQLELSKNTPVFLQEDGDFSFNQNIPNLVVTRTDLGANVEFGEVVDGKPKNGFVMKIEGKQTNGQALSDIVDAEMAEKIDGATRNDKRDEGTKCYSTEASGETCQVLDKVGFSYEERGNDYWKVVYLLRGDPHATYYLRIEFSSDGETVASQEEYGQIGWRVLNSIKIYK